MDIGSPYLSSFVPPSMNYKPHAGPSCDINLTAKKNQDNLLLKWWILNFLIAQLFQWKSVPLTSCLPPPPMKYKLNAPCRALTNDEGGDVSKRWEGVELLLFFLLRIDYNIDLCYCLALYDHRLTY